MLLELVGGTLTDISPVLSLFSNLLKAERLAMHPDTWYAILRHYEISSGAEVPGHVMLREDYPPMQVLCMPHTIFVTVELIRDGSQG